MDAARTRGHRYTDAGGCGDVDDGRVVGRSGLSDVRAEAAGVRGVFTGVGAPLRETPLPAGAVRESVAELSSRTGDAAVGDAGCVFGSDAVVTGADCEFRDSSPRGFSLRGFSLRGSGPGESPESVVLWLPLALLSGGWSWLPSVAGVSSRSSVDGSAGGQRSLRVVEYSVYPAEQATARPAQEHRRIPVPLPGQRTTGHETRPRTGHPRRHPRSDRETTGFPPGHAIVPDPVTQTLADQAADRCSDPGRDRALGARDQDLLGIETVDMALFFLVDLDPGLHDRPDSPLFQRFDPGQFPHRHLRDRGRMRAQRRGQGTTDDLGDAYRFGFDDRHHPRTDQRGQRIGDLRGEHRQRDQQL